MRAFFHHHGKLCSLFSHHHVPPFGQPATSESQYEVARRARCSRELLRQREEKHKLFQLGLLLKCPEENEEHVLTACMCALQTLHQTCVGLFERYSSSQYDDKM